MSSRIDRSSIYDLARRIKWFIDERLRGPAALRVLSLMPDGRTQGRMLFSYRAAFEGFSVRDGQRIPNSHTNYWASMQMVRTYLERGYAVDVIDSSNTSFIPREHYDVVLDVRWNLERLAPQLGPRCKKIMHLDTAHLLVGNAAELRRLLDLQRRKGATLSHRRVQQPSRGIEVADCATTTGNEWTLSTYRYAGKPIYRLPVPASLRYAWPEGRDWEACRRRFLWFSSGGLAYKGLDLALEAFAAMPEYQLTVCCPNPLEWEEDFARVYYKELYQTPNIRTVGWVDVNGEEFAKIVMTCAWTTLFSCAEGASTSVVNCMHAGLVPLLTYECGVDVDDFGFILRDCSIENIKHLVRSAASLPPQEVEARARAAWAYARANHTRERFAERYGHVVEAILSGRHGLEAERSVVSRPIQKRRSVR